MDYLKSALFLFAIIAIDASANEHCPCSSSQSSQQGNYIPNSSSGRSNCLSSVRMMPVAPQPSSLSSGYSKCSSSVPTSTTTPKPKVFVNKQPPIVVNRPAKCYTIPAGEPVVIKPAPVVIQRPGGNERVPISLTVTGKPIIINKKIVKVDRPIVKKYYVESHTERESCNEGPVDNPPLPSVDRCASAKASASTQCSGSAQQSHQQQSYQQSPIQSSAQCSNAQQSYQQQSYEQIPIQTSQSSGQKSPLANMLCAASSALMGSQSKDGSSHSGSGQQSTLSNILNAVSSAFGGINGAPSAGLGGSIVSSIVGSSDAGLGGTPLVGLFGGVSSGSSGCSSSNGHQSSQQLPQQLPQQSEYTHSVSYHGDKSQHQSNPAQSHTSIQSHQDAWTT